MRRVGPLFGMDMFRLTPLAPNRPHFYRVLSPPLRSRPSSRFTCLQCTCVIPSLPVLATSFSTYLDFTFFDKSAFPTANPCQIRHLLCHLRQLPSRFHLTLDCQLLLSALFSPYQAAIFKSKLVMHTFHPQLLIVCKSPSSLVLSEPLLSQISPLYLLLCVAPLLAPLNPSNLMSRMCNGRASYPAYAAIEPVLCTSD